jgi:lipopolysaccharide transport system ATP-binding protein
MESNSIIISNLSKVYKLNNASSINPLNNISLKIQKGESVGIVGKNGSGKSTLLKIISGLTKPSSGSVQIHGNVSSILDIGSNFLPELTGLENTKMLLQINGYSVKQNTNLINHIHAFSGIGDFFFQPIKIYSNGMFLRLAFSLVFNIPADVLVLDEVMLVGDEEFKMKGFELIKKLQTFRKTIILVSHNRQEIIELCSRCLWLKDGDIEMDGHPVSVLSAYFDTQKNLFDIEQQRKGLLKVKYENKDGTINLRWDKINAPGSQNIFVREFEISCKNSVNLLMSEPISIRLVLEKQNLLIGLNVCIVFYNHFEEVVFYIGPIHSINEVSSTEFYTNVSGVFELNCSIPPNLINSGDYYVSIWYGANAIVGLHEEDIFRMDKAFKIKVHPPENRVTFGIEGVDVSILPFLDWEIKKQ